MKRLLQWCVALFGWEERVQPRPELEQVAIKREEHRRKIDGFNQALAAAANLRELLQAELEKLRAREARLRARLQSAASNGDEAGGTQIAMELQQLAGDLADLEQRQTEAGTDAAELAQLRDELIAKARAELRDASDPSGPVIP